DAFFYGIGNSTSKPDRDRVSYQSIFFGTEVTKIISDKALLRISPGYWQFKSGLVKGGEFERASDAQYVTTRFTLSDRYLMDYRNTSFDNHWSSYVEIGFPVTSSVASYSRINFQTLTRIPVYKNTKFSVKARLEFLFSDDRSLVPYFAMPEVGSRSGLRGFSKDRFRNFSLSNLNLEYAVPLSSYFESFVLMDLAQTAPRVHELLGKQVHTDYGFGLRVTSLRHPFSVGMAKSTEGWKLFSNVSVRF
ncbi:hypothetical protein GWN42_03245, partial [candidate division KSB1 bacterium]|nr:hypothetical protein [candidate division KSB1 bacterium]